MNKYWFKHYNLLTFDEIDSTNSEAMRLAKTGISGNYIILASLQTSGRGRNGKHWHSDNGNIYFSLLLDVDIPIEIQPQLSLITGLAVYDTIKFFAKKLFSNLDCKLKWPNDILIGNKKLSGILLESVNVLTKENKIQKRYLIIGVGINITTSPVNIDKETTSLLKEGIIIKDSKQLLFIFMNSFEEYHTIWQNNGFVSLREVWLKRVYKLNHQITINNENHKISGIFHGIDINGNFQVKLKSGEIVALNEAEIMYG